MTKESKGSDMNELVRHRISRRAFVGGLAALAVGAATGGYFIGNKNTSVIGAPKTNKLISWGDDLFSEASYKAADMTLEKQLRSFGYNNDYIAFLKISDDRALLGINHETVDGMALGRPLGKDTADIILAAMGVSVIEIERVGDSWKAVRGGSKYNRRINAYNTEIDITGPAGGKTTIGTFANCAGGKTPWNTILTCEENIEKYFSGQIERHKRMGIGKSEFGEFNPRFDVNKNPNEPYNFGWVVEYDPFDPASRPKKRTALGRFKHESANCITAKDGRVVVYMGDDQEFEHLYKFISSKPYDGVNKDILDEGTLYTAKFHDSGKLTWMPIDPERLLHTREAASELGATPMDRPEDVEIAPNGNVYVSCTKNFKRITPDPANPRSVNAFGHILELKQADHIDLEGEWDVYMLGNKHFGCPDNIVFDSVGHMFVTTDGMQQDGLFLIENRQATRILSAPAGAEFTGPEFSHDYKSMFLAVQHPDSPLIPHVVTFPAYQHKTA